MGEATREIKFRAWDKGTDRQSDKAMMCQVSALDVSNDGRVDGVRVFNTKPDHGFTLGIEDCVLMQYTGLQDKNGVDIYESDVVETLSGKRGVVIWNDSRAAWDLYGAIHLLGDIPLWSISIIGNILANPELLTKAKS